ncbi:MAG: hypothetical protein JWO05_3791 [Gemmatimonadetes bacterium]|nr:hypothetical protein [Gemmatimonadota bacterium]
MNSPINAVHFQAPDGSHWTVHEISDSRDEPSRRALLFVGDHGFRRVRAYPGEWKSLSPEGLWELSWKV